MPIYKFGYVIKQRREELGYTQEDLAEGICSVPTLSRIENGERLPTKDHFEMLLQRLGFSETILYTYVDERTLFLHELKFKIRQAIILGHFEEAHDLLESYKKKMDPKSHLEQQFVLLNDILASPMSYSPEDRLAHLEAAIRLAGKLAAFFGCKEFPPYQYDNDKNIVQYKDYHFFDDCPLKEKTALGVVLFSILCNINYVTVFIENYFTEEIPQKFKFAYLQYYYLCDFIKDLDSYNGSKLTIDISLKSREFRNCLAHYGLGQYIEEKDIASSDILKGLTIKAFHLEYIEAKQQLFDCLNRLRDQIQNTILI